MSLALIPTKVCCKNCGWSVAEILDAHLALLYSERRCPICGNSALSHESASFLDYVNPLNPIKQLHWFAMSVYQGKKK